MLVVKGEVASSRAREATATGERVHASCGRDNKRRGGHGSILNKRKRVKRKQLPKLLYQQCTLLTS
jgi:hypothetical protein